VIDEADIFDEAGRTALNQNLADFELKTSDQIVVVTLKSLQGISIEDYGYKLGRQWQIGQKNKNNGALLIVAPSERKVRIEVGYGLGAVDSRGFPSWFRRDSRLSFGRQLWAFWTA
jgi:uncharacterized protein